MEKNDLISKLKEKIYSYDSEIVYLQENMTKTKPIGPLNGGKGEMKKAEFLAAYLKTLGFKIQFVNAPDFTVPEKERPNLIATYPEAKNKNSKIWIVCHLDVVPPGPLNLWETNPFKIVRKGDHIFGRGVEDNQQSTVAAILAFKAIKNLGLIPSREVNFLFASDEETGSEKGIKYVLNQKKKLFSKDDIIIVPDAGNLKGDAIEIAEKSILWLKVTVKGKQSHASRPHKGINAFRVASKLVCELDNFTGKFDRKNELFSPPFSTFEPTKHELNVENINTVPGMDVFYIDCRVLPEISLDSVIKEFNEYANSIAEKSNAEIKIDKFYILKSAPPTLKDSLSVIKLKQAIKDVRGIEPKLIGIGGGTFASFLRMQGLNPVVWQTIEGTAHQPNESSNIKNCMNDAVVFAYLMLLD